MTPRFLYPVNDYGLPRTHLLRPAEGQTALKGLSKEALARYYWTLKGLRLSYAFSLNGYEMRRDYMIDASPEPFARIERFPEVSAYFDEAYANVALRLDLAGVGVTAEGLFEIPFYFYESSLVGLYELSTEPPTGWDRVLTHALTGPEGPLALYLGLAEGVQFSFLWGTVEPVWSSFMYE